MSQNGQIALSGSLDKTVTIWQISTGQLIRTLTGHKRGVSAVALSPDGQTAVSAGEDTDIMIWRRLQ
ncbi:WD40 repeat domain-containing protein [Kamptonema formosum]|uniref:WD40 repeat domain-containing protein n=1 Tax=Kamptonema formosum TaxID=331992 RepID=UPI0009E44870